MAHKFHIPVLGLGFSIDTPLKVAKYGISSTVSIVDDDLIERIRAHHCKMAKEEYTAISKKEVDSRANRITTYLNFLGRQVEKQFNELKTLPFEKGNDLCKYFDLLPDDSQLKQGYELMMEYPEGERKVIFQNILKQRMEVGAIDVNIMSKVDRINPMAKSDFPADENSEALAGLRGYAQSQLTSSLILSAGMNPRLYSYLAQFDDFYPNHDGFIKKKVVLKVSDFRSALIQAKFLAKKGIWVSEFRIESGLNCGGHAFATEGYLLGPILEEFKQKKIEMRDELFAMLSDALKAKGKDEVLMPSQRVSVQGGIGTAEENEFLLKHYQLDSTGWGSPFLLVPEVTNVDEKTVNQLAQADEGSYYISNSSPLGIAFNNFVGNSMEAEQQERVKKGKPGSPCTKKYLCTNTEFTKDPICTASRKYQGFKIEELKQQNLTAEAFEKQLDKITEKLCLCEGLCSSTYQRLGILKPKESKAVAICPGPNLAYFSSIYTLDEMVSHIYGRSNLLQKVNRPHVFMKELDLYIQYLQTEISNLLQNFNEKKQSQLDKFKKQLLEGVDYYKNLFQEIGDKAQFVKEELEFELAKAVDKLSVTRV